MTTAVKKLREKLEVRVKENVGKKVESILKDKLNVKSNLAKSVSDKLSGAVAGKVSKEITGKLSAGLAGMADKISGIKNSLTNVEEKVSGLAGKFGVPDLPGLPQIPGIPKLDNIPGIPNASSLLGNSGLSSAVANVTGKLDALKSSIESNSLNVTKNISFGGVQAASNPINTSSVSDSQSVSSKDLSRALKSSPFLGKISSFFHKKDLDYLMNFIENNAQVTVLEKIAYIDAEIVIMGKCAKKLIAIDEKMRGAVDAAGTPSLQSLYDDVLSHNFESDTAGSGYYLGGPLDSDGFSDANTEKRDNLLRDLKSTDTVRTSRALLFFKMPYVLDLNRVNNLQYSFSNILYSIFLLRKLKHILENIDFEGSKFLIAKDSLNSQKEDLKTYFNIKNDV